MKKLILVLFFIVSIMFLYGCSEEDVVNNNPVTSTKGVFVLYEGVFNQPASYDYAFVNTDSNTVYSNVYQNSNNGAHLNAVPDGFAAYSGLYIVAQGNYGQAGTIYKINSDNNKLISLRNFGKNPYSLALANDVIYVTNTAGDFVSVMDINFNVIIDSVAVGSNPSDIVAAGGYVFVAKQSYTFENSLAVINQANHQVNKFYFTAPPVSVELVENWVCVSTYSNKKIYRFNASNAQLIDSITIQIPEVAVGTVCHGDSRTLFILGVADTTFAYNIGKSVYKLDLMTQTLDPNFNIQFSGNDDAYGIAYNYVERRLYIANSKSGQANGEVRVYNDNGTLIKTYPDIGGKFPKRMLFKL